MVVREPGRDVRMDVVTDHAETHRVPIDADTVTVQTIDAAGRRETRVLSVADALASSGSSPRSSTTGRLRRCSPTSAEARGRDHGTATVARALYGA